MSLADRIQYMLGKRDMRQVDLSRLTGIPQSTISLYVREGHIPKQDVLQKIADALEVSVFWLKGFDEDYNIPDDGTSISPVIIGKLIEAHYQKDELKFDSYAEFIYEKYVKQGDSRSARIIRNKIDGVVGNQVVFLELEGVQEIPVKDQRGSSDIAEIKSMLKEIVKKLNSA